MNRIQSTRIILFAFIVTFLALTSYSVAGGVKERMRARLPAINQMKDSGIVGENNSGFLEFKASGGDAGLVGQENTDRKKVYSAIAKKQGATAEFVGQRRAAQIASKAKSGHWIQDKSGNWYQK